MSWYFLYKFPIYWVIFHNIESILKLKKARLDLDAVDEVIIIFFLIAYITLLTITIIM